MSEVFLQLPVAVYFLNKTKIINGAKWIRIYLLGMGFFLITICILQTIRINLTSNSISEWILLGLSSLVAGILSIIFSLIMPDSRRLIYYAAKTENK
jgi:hypothetical protein